MKAGECSKAIESDRKISADDKNFFNECIVPQNERKVTVKREIILQICVKLMRIKEKFLK